MQLYLNFHHHTILISSNEEATLKKLKEEFHFFVRDQADSVQTTIELFKEVPPELPTMIAIKILDTCSIYRISSRQYIVYHAGALTIWDRQEESVRIYSLDPECLYEIGLLAIHSILGDKLDHNGLCRVHALGVSLSKVNAVVMLPPKGGKNTLLSHLLENPEVKVLSNDMPLIDTSGRVHVFPSKIVMDSIPEEGQLAKLKWTEFKHTQCPPKWTASLSQLEERIETQNLHQRTLLIAGFRLSQGQSILTPVSKWKMLLPLLEHMIVRKGLPEVREMFLKFSFTDFIKILHHGSIRTICALQLLRKSKCYYFYMGPDRAYNAQLLVDQMYEQQSH